MMFQAADDPMMVILPGLRENLSYLTTPGPREFDAQRASAMGLGTASEVDGTDGSPELSFKEAIEAYAQQHELVFKPKPGRMHNGQQVYGFGNISIYVDSVKPMISARREKNWIPVTLETLLNMHFRS